MLYTLLLLMLGSVFVLYSHTDIQSLLFSALVFAFFSFPFFFCISRKRFVKARHVRN
jgi:hypothetical protein